MTRDKLYEYIDCGNEIEFCFNGRMYSITYGIFNGKELISFCEFDQETTEVESFEDLLAVTREGHTVLQMWESLREEDVWIY